MMVSTVCPRCGGSMTIDDSNEVLFCPYCGNKLINTAQKIEVKQEIHVVHQTDRTNDPNLYIQYASAARGVVMIVRIAGIKQKYIFMNGQSMSFHLPTGPHNLVLKIGNKNYNRKIFIPEDNAPVNISAGFLKRAYIQIDQPNSPPTAGAVAGAANAVRPMQTAQRPQLPKSPLSVAAFVCAMVMIPAPVAVVLAIIDLAQGKKEFAHGLSIAALVVGSVVTLAILVNIL